VSPKTPTRPIARPPASTNRQWLWWGGGVAVVLVAAIVIALASSGATEAKAGEVSPRITVEGNPLPAFGDSGFGKTGDPGVGEKPPTITGKTFAGKDITFADDGKPRMVLFVAHWCPHCRAEVPRMVALAKSGAFKGVEVQTIATGTDPSAPNYPPSSWLKAEHWPFPVMADDAKFRAAAAYGLQFYPYFVFVGADGRVVGRATGEIEPAQLKGVLHRLASGQENVLPSG
jgi:cytochrome c biogenesis protein CcmG, thiol:disulfide interchange protein DsbE